MRFQARVDPEALRTAAQRLDMCIFDLQGNQQRLRDAIHEVDDSWCDVKSRQVLDELEKLMNMVESQIRDNQEVSMMLKRKAEKLSEYLDYRIR